MLKQTPPPIPVRTVRISAGSSSGTSKHFGADSDASTPEKSTTTERTEADVGSASLHYNSGKRGNQLWSATRLKRATRVSGSLLGGPARRGRQRRAEEDAEARDQEPLTATQDPESQQAQDVEPAAIDQPAMAAPISPLRTKHRILGKQPMASWTRAATNYHIMSFFHCPRFLRIIPREFSLQRQQALDGPW